MYILRVYNRYKIYGLSSYHISTLFTFIFILLLFMNTYQETFSLHMYVLLVYIWQIQLPLEEYTTYYTYI